MFTKDNLKQAIEETIVLISGNWTPGYCSRDKDYKEIKPLDKIKREKVYFSSSDAFIRSLIRQNLKEDDHRKIKDFMRLSLSNDEKCFLTYISSLDRTQEEVIDYFKTCLENIDKFD